ncbi:MAG TPA: hypothetical protein VEQ86_12100, partial [Xanthobacteraceae bacterium]|nr:hypothetical protein [Xanthobacteraceae bacterium]
VSVVRSDSWFDGGAHPNQHADTILWDDVAHKRTNIRALFTETADNGRTMTALAQAPPSSRSQRPSLPMTSMVTVTTTDPKPRT